MSCGKKKQSWDEEKIQTLDRFLRDVWTDNILELSFSISWLDGCVNNMLTLSVSFSAADLHDSLIIQENEWVVKKYKINYQQYKLYPFQNIQFIDRNVPKWELFIRYTSQQIPKFGALFEGHGGALSSTSLHARTLLCLKWGEFMYFYRFRGCRDLELY